MELEKGNSPEKYVDRSVKYLGDGIRNNNKIAGPHDELASSLLIRAEYELIQRKPPENTIRQTESWIAKSLELGPSRSAAFVARGDAEILKAKWMMISKKDPSTALNRAREAYSEAIQKNQRDRNALIGLSRSQLMLAQNSSADQKDGFIKAGLSSVDRVLAIAPDTAVAFAIKGKLLELRGDNQSANTALDQARKIDATLFLDLL